MLDVLGLGLCTIDILIRLTELPTWEHNGKIQALRIDGGGPVGTALVAAARLGLRCGYIGPCGNDDLGNLKRSALDREMVDTSHMTVRNCPEGQIILVYVHAETGERIFVSGGDWSAFVFQKEELDLSYLASAPILLLDGTHPEAAGEAARLVRARGGLVVMDGCKTEGCINNSLRPIIPWVSVLICGAGFAQAFTGLPDSCKAGEALLSLGIDRVVQTDGAKGSQTQTQQGEFFNTPAFEVDVVDTTGAGDVFHGAYLVGLSKGWSPQVTALFASATAAIKCTQLGGRAGIPTYSSVIEFLQNHNPQGSASVCARFTT
jgi:sulfofructose kinase